MSLLDRLEKTVPRAYAVQQKKERTHLDLNVTQGQIILASKQLTGLVNDYKEVKPRLFNPLRYYEVNVGELPRLWSQYGDGLKYLQYQYEPLVSEKRGEIANRSISSGVSDRIKRNWELTTYAFHRAGGGIRSQWKGRTHAAQLPTLRKKIEDATRQCIKEMGETVDGDLQHQRLKQNLHGVLSNVLECKEWLTYTSRLGKYGPDNVESV